MLQLTRLSGPVFALNPDLIERAESTPDTVVTLVNGSKYVIRESLDELIALVRDYRAGVVVAAQSGTTATGHGYGPGPTSRHAAHLSDAAASHASNRGTVVFLHAENGEE